LHSSSLMSNSIGRGVAVSLVMEKETARRVPPRLEDSAPGG
jgi:hypothetical protein